MKKTNIILLFFTTITLWCNAQGSWENYYSNTMNNATQAGKIMDVLESMAEKENISDRNERYYNEIQRKGLDMDGSIKALHDLNIRIPTISTQKPPTEKASVRVIRSGGIQMVDDNEARTRRTHVKQQQRLRRNRVQIHQKPNNPNRVQTTRRNAYEDQHRDARIQQAVNATRNAARRANAQVRKRIYQMESQKEYIMNSQNIETSIERQFSGWYDDHHTNETNTEKNIHSSNLTQIANEIQGIDINKSFLSINLRKGWKYDSPDICNLDEEMKAKEHNFRIMIEQGRIDAILERMNTPSYKQQLHKLCNKVRAEWSDFTAAHPEIKSIGSQVEITTNKITDAFTNITSTQPQRIINKGKSKAESLLAQATGLSSVRNTANKIAPNSQFMEKYYINYMTNLKPLIINSINNPNTPPEEIDEFLKRQKEKVDDHVSKQLSQEFDSPWESNNTLQGRYIKQKTDQLRYNTWKMFLK